jgi:hypothetical protein
MTALEIVAFIALPLSIAMFGWLAVLIREHRRRQVVQSVKAQKH